MMCFRGGGIGHKSMRDATDFFKNDRDQLDLKVSTTVSDSEIEEEEIEERVEERGQHVEGMNESEDLGEHSEAESELDESREELEEEDYDPEGNGGGIDEDMIALGYSEL